MVKSRNMFRDDLSKLIGWDLMRCSFRPNRLATLHFVDFRMQSSERGARRFGYLFFVNPKRLTFNKLTSYGAGHVLQNIEEPEALSKSEAIGLVFTNGNIFIEAVDAKLVLY